MQYLPMMCNHPSFTIWKKAVLSEQEWTHCYGMLSEKNTDIDITLAGIRHSHQSTPRSIIKEWQRVRLQQRSLQPDVLYLCKTLYSLTVTIIILTKALLLAGQAAMAPLVG